MDTEGRFTVYMIHAGNKTYIGYTVCQKRRLRQHNKELKGGARATRVASGWQHFCTLSSADWTSVRAQQVEWIAKHPTRQRKCPAKYRGVHGRVASLVDLCSHVPEPLTIRLRPDLLQMAQALPLPDRITYLNHNWLLCHNLFALEWALMRNFPPLLYALYVKVVGT
jgi:predicted GIY-YIG superfamily endonuclease